MFSVKGFAAGADVTPYSGSAAVAIMASNIAASVSLGGVQRFPLWIKVPPGVRTNSKAVPADFLCSGKRGGITEGHFD
jgi:hypothetical protein